MAATMDDREVVKKKDTPEGHEVKHSFVMCPLSGRLPLHIMREYHTECRLLPTSWRLRINFQQRKINGPISCSVALKRIDAINRPVKVFVWMACFISYQTVFRPGCFTNDNMLPNEVIEGTVAEATLSRHDVAYLLNQRVLFQFFMSIDFCHLRNFHHNVSSKKDISGMLFSRM